MNTLPTTPDEFGIFLPDQHGQAEEFFRAYGFAALRGVFSEAELVAMEQECVAAQEELTAGRLHERHGTEILIEGDAGDKANQFANYVTYMTELSPAVTAGVHHQDVLDLMSRLLHEDYWLLDEQRFGVVYQDARPGPESSYTRIGWHSDWQSGPHLDIWPAVAFTFHIDEGYPESNTGEVDRVIWERFLASTGMTDVCVELACGTPGSIDKFAYRSNSSVQLAATGIEFPAERFTATTGEALSDHPPVVTTFRWNIPAG